MCFFPFSLARSAFARLRVSGLIAGALCLTSPLLHSAVISVSLSGSNATGGVNVVGFDTEINEPNGPPSRDHTSSGNGNSHGFAYFQYAYHPDNPDAFNDYDGFWSIIVSSHTVANPAYYQSLLQKAGAVAYDNLTLTTQVLHPNPGAFDIGSLTYDTNRLTGIGTEILDPTKFELTISRADYSFNVLNESTAPGTWTGYPYYYWGIDNYTLSISNISGEGLTFVNGVLTTMDFQANVRITSPMAPNVTWDGTLSFDGLNFVFNINESEFVNGFGDLHIVMDRAGTISLIPEPTTGLLLAIGCFAITLRRRPSTETLS